MYPLDISNWRLRTHSTFAYFTPGELETGFRRLEQAIVVNPAHQRPKVPRPSSRSNGASTEALPGPAQVELRKNGAEG